MVDQEIENLKKNKKSLEEFRLSEIEVLYNDKKNEEIVIKNIKDQIDNLDLRRSYKIKYIKLFQVKKAILAG